MKASHHKLKSTIVAYTRDFSSDTLNKRETFLPFALPDLDESELNEIKEALESGWVTIGTEDEAVREGIR